MVPNLLAVAATFSLRSAMPIKTRCRAAAAHFSPTKCRRASSALVPLFPVPANAPSAAAVTALFNSYGIAGARNPLGSNLGFNNDGTLFTQTGALNYRGPNGSDGYAVVGGNVRQPVGQQIQFLNSLKRKTGFRQRRIRIFRSTHGLWPVPLC